jgi:hypothetical protein
VRKTKLNIIFNFVFILYRLPLVPRRPLSAFEVTDNKKRSNQAAAARKRGDDAGEPSPPPPEDMDERLIFDAHRLANQYVNEMVCFSFSRLLILFFL